MRSFVIFSKTFGPLLIEDNSVFVLSAQNYPVGTIAYHKGDWI